MSRKNQVAYPHVKQLYLMCVPNVANYPMPNKWEKQSKCYGLPVEAAPNGQWELSKCVKYQIWWKIALFWLNNSFKEIPLISLIKLLKFLCSSLSAALSMTALSRILLKVQNHDAAYYLMLIFHKNSCYYAFYKKSNKTSTLPYKLLIQFYFLFFRFSGSCMHWIACSA